MEEYVYIPVKFDPKLSMMINPSELPENWNTDPSPQAIKQIGDSWAENQRSVILKVPSAIVPIEKNFLINPSHPNFSKLKIGTRVKFDFDPRLLKS